MHKTTSYKPLKTKISTSKFSRLFYSLYSKCSPFALMQARRRLRKLTIDFLIASCGSSSHIIRSAVFGSGIFCGCGFKRLNLSSNQPQTW